MIPSAHNITTVVTLSQPEITNKDIYRYNRSGYGVRAMKNRIKELRELKGWSQYDLAAKVNSTAQQIGRLENNQRRLSDFWMIKLAEALNCRPEDLISTGGVSKVPILGYVGAGSKIYPHDDLPLMPNGMKEQDQAYLNCEMIDAPPGYGAGIVALRIKGDSMLPFMPDGTVVYYEQRTTGCDENLNKLCIVKLSDGSAMLKTVRRGYKYGHYNLESYNAPLIEDARLEWCAKVIFIKPL